MKPDRPRLRCAVYTRKSTEEGLDQEFNSLDAQREACEAYILSQRHEGWTLIPTGYDDGGFTGGNMERPGLKRLLADVHAGHVDVIVVYKVDRLTRALSDFAKIVEILDGQGASFVSVTQAFNTTTSMGRLTLNVLLSFAQFEREVISERVRDKVAASKKKGMWMGGQVPLGYVVHERKLVIQPTEAETVRTIMRRYLEVGSVRALIPDLAARRIVTKIQHRKDGGMRGGGSFTRGALYHLLKNRIYRGEIVHHGHHYPGQHEALVEPALFDAVQCHIEANGVERREGHRSHLSLLAGVIRDGQGAPLSPSHAAKAGRRYRYYISNPVSRSDATVSIRLPAPPFEQAVVAATARVLADHRILPDMPAAHLRRLHAAVAALQTKLGGRQSAIRATLLSLDLRLTVTEDRIEGSLCRRAVLTTLDPATDWSAISDRMTLSIAATPRRRGQELKLRIDPPKGIAARDEKLVSTIIRAHAARDQLRAVATLDRNQARDLRRLARLSYLAPDIVTAIFEGRQPATLSTRSLVRIADLPARWSDQRRLLGFS